MPARTAPSPQAAEADCLSAIRSFVRSTLRPKAREIDLDGLYPEDILRRLGALGAFAQHHTGLAANGSFDFPAAIDATAVIAEECVSTAFCTWCQDACGWYLENTSNTALRDKVRDGIATGKLLGGTGLSNPMKALSGIEPLRLKGKRAAGGYRVSGILPWVSNLGDGHYFGVVFADADDEAHTAMALVREGDENIEVRHNARFVGLEGTATRSVAFRDAFISDDFLIADPCESFTKKIRPGFILLQIGIAIGLTRAVLTSLHDTRSAAGGSNAFLPQTPEALRTRLSSLEETTRKLASTPLSDDPAFRPAVLRARLEAAELALAAAHTGMLFAGARGYVLGANENRRLREAYFVAMLTPTIKHLRKDLAAL